jgi:hypothetical protein
MSVFKWRYISCIFRGPYENFYPLYDNLYIFTTSCLILILIIPGVIYKAETGALFGSNFQIIVTLPATKEYLGFYEVNYINSPPPPPSHDFLEYQRNEGLIL